MRSRVAFGQRTALRIPPNVGDTSTLRSLVEELLQNRCRATIARKKGCAPTVIVAKRGPSMFWLLVIVGGLLGQPLLLAAALLMRLATFLAEKPQRQRR